jgi:hypothetical protein
MQQEEEIVFSFNKIKRIFLKYWYIVLIAFVIGVLYVGVSSAKAYSAAKDAADKAAKEAQAAKEALLAQETPDTEKETVSVTYEDGTTDGDLSSIPLNKLSPADTTYFNIVRYIKVDWSEIYPDVSVSNANSAEENYYILSRINNQTTYEKDILTDCSTIQSFQTFRDDVNAKLRDSGYTELTNTDSISFSTTGNDIITITIYSQCSISRINCILDAVMDSYVSHGQTLFNLGKCSVMVTNDVKAYTKGTDGKYTTLNMTATDWLTEQLSDDDSSSVAAADVVTSDSNTSSAATLTTTATTVSLKSVLVTKKNIAVLLGMIVAGLFILCLIAVFDHVLDVPEEAAFTGLDKLGEVSLSPRVFTERVAAIAKDKGYNKIALVTMQTSPVVDAMCSGADNASNDGASCAALTKLVYPDEYLAGLSDIHSCDAAIIAIHGGVDKKTVLSKCVENLNIDNPNLLGFVWIAQ